MKHLMKSITFDLSTLDWRLTGWHPDYWKLATTAELGFKLEPDVPSIQARVPGSVQQALRDAGMLPDWTFELNSRQCEWVENRHWRLEADLPPEWLAVSGRKILHCKGLDYQGAVLLNDRQVGVFQGTFIEHRFDLTPALNTEGSNKLVILFTQLPYFLGQVGYTSRIAEWKPRFNYAWDWMPRLVQVGIWDDIHLIVGDEGIRDVSVCADFNLASGRGSLKVTGALEAMPGGTLAIRVVGPDGEEVHRHTVAASGAFDVRTDSFAVSPWWPNGENGDRLLYDVSIRLLDRDEKVIDEKVRRVGFRQIEWRACAGAPPKALPWICRVNGRDIFLQGFNWVPIRPNFADVTEADYRQRLELYRDLGTNLLRVWGGAVLEKDCFYRICDELGLLVWQEFPLSSSGLDNWPPEEPAMIDAMRSIVISYIRRRQHHASLLMWCGGNELQSGVDGKKGGGGRPLDESHPMLGMMARTVAEFDPGRRFVATSSTGPRFMAAKQEFGQGLHHDVHGPWNHNGPLEPDWYAYWDGDDSLFRSETGMPGAQPVDLTRSHGGKYAWPGDLQNLWWIHCASWWLQPDPDSAAAGARSDLESYVRWSQKRQAEALSYAAAACKKRFPAMGGFIVWMGHDCFPTPLNGSVIDYLGRPKPAALALATVFHSPPGSEPKKVNYSDATSVE